MKYFIHTLLVTFIFSGSVNAQDTLKKMKIGIDFSYSDQTVFKNGLLPSLTFSSDKHILFAGPSFIYYGAKDLKPFVGVQAGYKFFPYGLKKKFNLFFEYNLNFVKGDIENQVTYYVWEIRVGPGTQVIHTTSLDSYFGFGFRWNISKRLYFSSYAGLGWGLHKEEYTYHYGNGESWDKKGRLVPRDSFTPNGLFKIGFGYDILSFKKRK